MTTPNKQSISHIRGHVNHTTKKAWEANFTTITEKLAQAQKVQAEILSLEDKKMAIFDEIEMIRKDLIRNCIHPTDLVNESADGVLHCMFCDTHFKIVTTQ